MKKLRVMVMVGVLGVTAIAPMTTNAAAPVSDKTNVGYVAGATDPGGNGTYVVTVPKDVVFKDTTPISGFDVSLLAWDETTETYKTPTTGDLPENLSVKVEALSTNSYKLKNSKVTSAEGVWQYQVGGETITNTPGADEGPETATEVGTLTPASPTLAGTATMTTKPATQVPNNTRFGDTLTFTITETASGLE